MRLYDFRTEYRENPIGLTEKAPRFSWKIESQEKDTLQTAYEIKVTDEKSQVISQKKRQHARYLEKHLQLIKR